jgi:glyoxylase-like metal-dependent hydrolase (beta-lactamase superfamily II)/rhodanese-related sulfurtransferase
MLLETWSSDGCRTHLLASERTREAALVDPLLTALDADLARLRERGLVLRWAIDTHTHADHLSSGAALRERCGAGYLMHALAPTARATLRVGDGEELGLGEATLRFTHVPGHTRDSLMIAVDGALLTGDFLFLGVDGAGRLDLPGADVGAHYESLRRLDGLPDAVEIRPAHDYRGRSVSTLGAERAANPVLRSRSREDYLRWWERLRRPSESWMAAVVAANAAGAFDARAVDVPTERPTCAACAEPPADPALLELTPRELAARLEREKLVLLDVREPDEYDGELGRIRGSRLIPLGELSARRGELPAGPVVAVCHSGKRSARAAAELKRAGRTDVAALAGGMLAWNAAGLPVERAARR